MQRLAALVLILGVAALGNAQLLTEVSESENYNLFEVLSYVDASGFEHSVDFYNNIPYIGLDASEAESHGFSNLAVPGTSGLTSGYEDVSVDNNLVNTDATATFTAHLTGDTWLNTAVTSPGADNAVRGTASVLAFSELGFTLATESIMTISGVVIAGGSKTMSSAFLFDNTRQTQTYFEDNAATGTFNATLDLLPGDYSLRDLIGPENMFDDGPYGNTDFTGSAVSDIYLTAAFTPAPEPVTFFGLGGFAMLALKRVGRRAWPKQKKNPPSP